MLLFLQMPILRHQIPQVLLLEPVPKPIFLLEVLWPRPKLVLALWRGRSLLLREIVPREVQVEVLRKGAGSTPGDKGSAPCLVWKLPARLVERGAPLEPVLAADSGEDARPLQFLMRAKLAAGSAPFLAGQLTADSSGRCVRMKDSLQEGFYQGARGRLYAVA
jgi:hypothetical protein